MAPWGWIPMWYVRVTRILDRLLMCFNKYWKLHELITINTDRINARFNYEMYWITSIWNLVPVDSEICVAKLSTVHIVTFSAVVYWNVALLIFLTDQKAWRKRQLCYKLARREQATSAVTDIIIMGRSKRAPMGFSFAG